MFDIIGWKEIVFSVLRQAKKPFCDKMCQLRYTANSNFVSNGV